MHLSMDLRTVASCYVHKQMYGRLYICMYVCMYVCMVADGIIEKKRGIFSIIPSATVCMYVCMYVHMRIHFQQLNKACECTGSSQPASGQAYLESFQPGKTGIGSCTIDQLPVAITHAA